MQKPEKQAVNFASLCSLVSGVRVLDKEKIQPHEASVLCEATSSQSKCEYYFDHVINGKGEIASSYRKYLHPLIDQTLSGKSVAMVANSIPKNDFAPYLVGVDDAEKPSPALLVAIVGQLLKVQAGAKSAGSVTFSWFKLNCDKSETLVDVLREASGPQGSDKKGHDLLLREVGRGRGMTVSGLWEVEIASAGDIEAIINHVLQVYDDGDDMTKAHSVFQFVYTPANAKKAAAPASKSIMASQHDAAGVGRFNFIVLSSLTAYDYNTLSLAKIAHHPMAAFEHDWIAKLQHVMEWMASGRPSPPYHKSRLVLLLRDVLCGRQPCALLQCIDKFTANNGHKPNPKQSDVVSVTDMQEMYMDSVHRWFQIMSSISHTRDPKLVTSNPFAYPTENAPAPAEVSKKHSAAGPPRTVPSGAAAAAKARPGVATTPSAAKRAASPHNRPIAGAPGAADKRSNSTPRERPGIADDAELRDNLKKKLEGNASGSSAAQNDISPAWAASAAAHVSASSPNPPPPPPTRDVNDLVPTTIPFADPHSHSHGHGVAEVSGHDHDHDHSSLRRKSTFHGHGAQGHGHGHEGKDDHRGGMSDADKHAMTLLNKALEEQKRQTASTAQELEEMRDKYESCREAYELLVDTIKQEGSMLKQKDRENYNKALRDLKDYAIYKDVIEAAMVRLQGELDAVLQENKNLKEESEKSLRVMRKKLNTSQRYDHYATSVHKKAAEADGQVATLEAEKKKLAREKDHLQDSLAHCRAQLQEMQDKYENEENNISYNALLLKVNEYENNPSFRKYKSRRGPALGESIANGQAEQELAALKVAHAKALEKLMTLQEENDDMRQALIELVPDDDELAEIAASTLKGGGGGGGLKPTVFKSNPTAETPIGILKKRTNSNPSSGKNSGSNSARNSPHHSAKNSPHHSGRSSPHANAE